MDGTGPVNGKERILLIGGGDLGQRVARLLAARIPSARIWGLRRTPPSLASSLLNANGTSPASQPSRLGSDGTSPALSSRSTACETSRTHSSQPDVDQPPVSAIEWLAADVTRPETLHRMPTDPTRVVIALSPGSRNEAAYRAVFIDGLRHVVQRLDRGALRRLVFVSSSAVYGDHGGDWVDEDTPPAPPGMNGAALLQAEQWLHARDLPSTTLRLSGLYGPGRLQLLDRLRGGQARVPRDFPHWANRMHIEDAAAAVAHLLMLPKARTVYIGADDTPLPIDVLYDYLAGQLGCALPAAGPAPAGVGSKKLCNARLRADGFVPAWPDARAGYAALITALAASSS